MSDELCERPRNECATANGRHHNFSIHLHARSLAFDALTVDTILHLARTVYDYGRWLGDQGRPNESVEAKEAAELMGRYGLAIMADRCRLYIHEIGHAYLNDGPGSSEFTYKGEHCQWNCCNDVLMTHWWCWVRAALGLPFEAYRSAAFSRSNAEGGTDFLPDSVLDFQELDPCSHDKDKVYGVRSQANHVWSCGMRVAGIAGYSPEYFCSTGCVASFELGGVTRYYELETKTLYNDWTDLCSLP